MQSKSPTSRGGSVSCKFYPPPPSGFRVTSGKLSLLAGLAALFIALFLTACDNSTTPNDGAENKTPVAADYDVTGLSHIYDGNSKAVSISPKADKSNGARTVFYTGAEGTTYSKSATEPQGKGKYAVTFDVAAATGWNAASGLSAGTMEIGDQIDDPQTPVADDFTISGTGTFTYNGSPRIVSITAKSGKTKGAVTVKYNGDTTAPSSSGTYTVTFDVAAAIGWNAASGLSAGTLTINPPSGGSNTDPKKITITGIPGSYDSAMVVIMSTSVEDGAMGKGTISSGSVTFDLMNQDETPWTGNGLYVIQLSLGNDTDDSDTGYSTERLYVYTNGKTFEELDITENGWDLIIKLPPFSITEATSTITFDKFFDMTDIFGTDPDGSNTDAKKITITGITGSYDSARVGILSIDGYVAMGSGQISNGSVTVDLRNQDETAWTGNGSYFIDLTLDKSGDDSSRKGYVYTNKKTFDELGITDIRAWEEEEIAKLPKFSISATTSTITLDKFFDITDL